MNKYTKEEIIAKLTVELSKKDISKETYGKAIAALPYINYFLDVYKVDISTAFTWSLTPQGGQFWGDIYWAKNCPIYTRYMKRKNNET